MVGIGYVSSPDVLPNLLIYSQIFSSVSLDVRGWVHSKAVKSLRIYFLILCVNC